MREKENTFLYKRPLIRSIKSRLTTQDLCRLQANYELNLRLNNSTVYCIYRDYLITFPRDVLDSNHSRDSELSPISKLNNRCNCWVFVRLVWNMRPYFVSSYGHWRPDRNFLPTCTLVVFLIITKTVLLRSSFCVSCACGRNKYTCNEKTLSWEYY